MGNKDNVTRDYMTNERFADMINTIVFGGKEIIKEENLREIDTVTSKVSDNLKTTKRERDMIKISETEENIFILFGIENQAKPDFKMPLRIMEYNAAEYRKQIKQKSKYIKPIITLVVFWSANGWKTSKSLLDMMRPEVVEVLKKSPYNYFFKDYL